MQYIDFTEDILKPLSQHEIGFENGFALSQFDPNVAGYYENQFPEGFPIDTLSSRFLSLLAEDPIRDGYEYISIYQTDSDDKIVYIVWERVTQPTSKGDTVAERIINGIISGDERKALVIKTDTVEHAMNLVVDRLDSMGYVLEDGYWERKELAYNGEKRKGIMT